MTGEDSGLLGSDAMLTGVYRRFGEMCCLQLQGLAVSQTLLTLYQSAWHYIPQELNLHQYCCEKLKISDIRTVYFHWHNNVFMYSVQKQPMFLCSLNRETNTVVRIRWGVRKLRKRWNGSIEIGHMVINF